MVKYIIIDLRCQAAAQIFEMTGADRCRQKVRLHVDVDLLSCVFSRMRVILIHVIM